ncbi:MAG: sugar phosphate isomerase/epimerase [Trueperaceae bacterium]|nr:sugar phosphate isomerase/epimerase [Trueperaceae bacterium]
MKAAAHTMSTPRLELLPALDLYARLGFDGVEVLYTEGYPCALHPSAAEEEVRPLLQRLSETGLRVAQLTPYANAFDDEDPAVREAAVAEIERCIELAGRLGCGNVRLWAGQEPEPGEGPGRYERLIDALRGLAAKAVAAGVSLNIENHAGSYALCSETSVRIIEAVGAGLGITYDPANLLQLGEGEPLRALERQLPYVRHVHFKDLRALGDRKYEITQVGEGDVPWAELMPVLRAGGYAEYFSTEYEKRWHPDELPEPEVGLRHELSELRRLWV